MVFKKIMKYQHLLEIMYFNYIQIIEGKFENNVILFKTFQDSTENLLKDIKNKYPALPNFGSEFSIINNNESK